VLRHEDVRALRAVALQLFDARQAGVELLAARHERLAPTARLAGSRHLSDLASRWTLVVDTRVVESEEAPNFELLGRKTEAPA
jgi:hypothetical protein